MKIAICFSGAIRNFHTCIPTIQKYLLNNINADIFLHLWSYQIDPSNPLDINFKWQESLLTDQLEENILTILKPKSYVIDKYDHEWEKRITSIIEIDKYTDLKEKNYAYSCCGMYFKIYQSYLLAKNYADLHNINYDIIIRARLDFIWENPIKPNDFINFDNKTAFLIKDRYAHFSKLETNDKFFAGNPEVMEYLSSTYLYLQKYQGEGITIEGQNIMEKHIKNRSLSIKWIGDKDTYYKCMPRHTIKFNNRNIYIHVRNNFILNELAYYLLFCGYNIFINKTDDTENPVNYLKSFTRFSYYDVERDRDKIFDYIFVDKNTLFSSEYNCKIGLIEMDKNEIKADIAIQINPEIINNNILHLNRFIFSLIQNNIMRAEYIFNDISLIDIIPVNEKIIYKYTDHGYYNCEYIKQIKQENKNNHQILFNNKKIIINRNEFYIKNIHNFYNKEYIPY